MGEDNRIHTFNSTAYDWHQWSLSSRVQALPLNMVDQTNVISDGSVIHCAVGISYEGNDYVFAGPRAAQRDGCLHLKL